MKIKDIVLGLLFIGVCFWFVATAFNAVNTLTIQTLDAVGKPILNAVSQVYSSGEFIQGQKPASPQTLIIERLSVNPSIPLFFQKTQRISLVTQRGTLIFCFSGSRPVRCNEGTLIKEVKPE